MIVMMAGLPGSGKSTLARAVAQRLSGVVLDKDAIRASIFPPEQIAYSTEQDDLLVQFMLNAAEYLLKNDPATLVFLDGRPFAKRYQVETVVAFAQRVGTPWRIVECVCPEKTVTTRLRADMAASKHIAGNRDIELYRRVKKDFQKIRRRKLVVRTSLKLETCVRRIEEYLRAK